MAVADADDHVRNYHNFTDDVARENFLRSKYFVFEKVAHCDLPEKKEPRKKIAVKRIFKESAETPNEHQG
jgi:hypothetical protein